MLRKIALLTVMLLTLSVFQASAQNGAVWTIEYFNNPYIIGTVMATQTTDRVAFNWYQGAPATGVNVDNFSARLRTDVALPAGRYRFWVLADDGVTLTLNLGTGRPTINTFNSPQPGTLLSADVDITQPVTNIFVDYQDFTGSAYLYITWANLATNPTGPNFPPDAPIAGTPGGGVGTGTRIPGGSVPTTGLINTANWTAVYYNNPTLSGFPSLIQTEVAPDHNWGLGAPFAGINADNFSVRWTSVQTLSAGTYTVTVRADDGVRVIVDGIAYINQFPGVANEVFAATFNLAAGQHTFVVELYEAQGAAFLQYALTSGTTTTPGSPPVNTGASLRVNVFELNVRQSPAVGSPRLLIVRRGESYPIVGRNADSTWWQINANGTTGWVAASFVTV
jgi:hypothetical protein